MSNESESNQDAESKATVSSLVQESPRGRLLLKRLGIGFFLVTLIYLFSYGPMVMYALNKYGRGNDQLRIVMLLLAIPCSY